MVSAAALVVQYAAQMAQIAAAIKKNTWKNRDPLLEEDTCAC